MFELQQFENPSFGSIRTVEKEGEPWFVAKDVANILGYSDTQAMTRRLDEEDKCKLTVPDVLSGTVKPIPTPPLTLINESGFYVSVLGSKKPEAKAFKKWVTSEVLPSIRKDGFYGTPAMLVPQNMLPQERAKRIFNAHLEVAERR